MDNSDKENFKTKYIKNFSISIWSKWLSRYSYKIGKLKTVKWKEDYTYLLFTKYLQLIENFIIFLLVCFDEDWIDVIFYNSRKIEEKIKKLLSLDQDLRLTMESKEILGEIMKLYISSNHVEYKKLISESLKDYFQYKDVLNCYKHGFRLDNIWKNNWTASIWDNKFKIAEYDSWIIYYTKRSGIIFENRLSFNYEYIVLKSDFLISFIENIKLNYLNQGKKINITTAYIMDNSINKKYWSSHISIPIFEIIK
ncbi:MAG: hypothetical protein ACD_2C00193G0001 [uncultured bacterium (gcode 4)]|uniref:Uncharacterized protein n=1 Tax=uncultured bacterium (gcode 4) TaxID=1234023 RepID=K2H0G6_9BACT|nr:MAG: hypothetical protein ACD_2C00193G0001 [uncultured bacterium (gcode 4)]